MKLHRIAWKTIIAGFIAVLLMCRASTAGPVPIKIGFVGDFSEVSKAYTENAFMAARMAISDFNAEGGFWGRPVQLIRRDGGNDPDRHYRHVIDLVRDEKIVAVFGGASSLCLLKASSACKAQQIPYLISIGNSQSVVVENGHPFVFMFEPNTRMESVGFSIFATLMPWQRYAWIGPDYVWGHDIFGFFKEHFENIGAPVEWAAEVWHPLGTKDFTKNIKHLIDARPDALIVATWGEDLRHFIRQAKTSGLFNKMAAFGWFSLISEDAEHMLPEGIWNVSRGPFNYLADKHPQTKRFVREFVRQYNTYPLGFTICCYDSLLAWRQAVLNAGSAKPAAVADALKGMPFVGLRGDSVIRAIDGQMNCPTFFGRIVYRPEYPIAVIESVIEIPASKTWLPENEVQSRRSISTLKTDN
ncbi:ABC transporter substrate-binding protein [uncultured Desulfosarcina sp.]|uniref:ABC transporter substrate-binding protein n=1 Tax=uncultured Desulfosarcina sp. TaxID=218289 RepID=UPI0029C60DA0|nr:ABC transporter substrate-binding protein [uncultured Desulfosarcina sp.]